MDSRRQIAVFIKSRQRHVLIARSIDRFEFSQALADFASQSAEVFQWPLRYRSEEHGVGRQNGLLEVFQGIQQPARLFERDLQSIHFGHSPVWSIPPSPPREPVGHGGPKFVVPPSGGVFNSDRLKPERRTRWSNTVPEHGDQIKRDVWNAAQAFKKSVTNTTRAGSATLLANFWSAVTTAVSSTSAKARYMQS